MISPIRLFLIGLALLSLGACAQTKLYNDARSMSPSGNAFQNALYRGYMRLSTFEHEAYGEYITDKISRDEYATRAMAAGRGETVLPEAIGFRSLPGNMLGEVARVRGRLMAVLDETARDKAPLHAASAQVMFDCWLEELEEGYQPPDIARCRDSFYGALAAAEAVLAPADLPPVAITESGPFLVFFDWDKSDITAGAAAILKRVVRQAKETGAAAIHIVGHADTSGPDSYNMRLSRRRANAVKAELVANGIDSGSITLEARGEKDPLVSTGDGVREPQNRRAQGVWIYN